MSQTLEFLTPEAATAAADVGPLARSPIEWAHRGDGAEFDQRAGWRVVAGYGAAAKETAACQVAVGVADRSFLGKLELQGKPEVVASIVASLAGGAALELGQAVLDDEVWWCPLTAGRVLVVTPPEESARLRGELEAAAADAGAPFASVAELTCAYGSNAVVGPLAREAFARTTALDLRPDRFAPGAFAPVSVARTPGMVLRERGDRFLHLFGAGYAYYTWSVFVDAAQHLGGRAVGDQALRAVSGERVVAGA